MDQTTLTLLIAVAVLLVAVAMILILRGRRQHIDLTATPPSRTIARPTPPPAPIEPEGDGVADEAAAAIENVVGEMLGIDAHRDHATDGVRADDLTRLKGLGPKAAARLNELGVIRFDQIAGWTDDDISRIDIEMGAFKGRILRDKWVEQANYLAAGDIAGFEARFGKLGA